MKTFDDLYPGRFLRAGNLSGRQATLTIDRVDREELVGDDGKPKMRATLYFRETQLGLVACKTNGLLIKALFGPLLADWVGKKITLGPDTWNGEPCIRVQGAPHLSEPIEVEIQLPRRKAVKRRLVPTGGK